MHFEGTHPCLNVHDIMIYSPKQTLWNSGGSITELMIQANQIGILTNIKTKMKEPSR